MAVKQNRYILFKFFCSFPFCQFINVFEQRLRINTNLLKIRPVQFTYPSLIIVKVLSSTNFVLFTSTPHFFSTLAAPGCCSKPQDIPDSWCLTLPEFHLSPRLLWEVVPFSCHSSCTVIIKREKIRKTC